MNLLLKLITCLLTFAFSIYANASPCGTPTNTALEDRDLQVWQDCGLGTWHLRATGGVHSATIYASSAMTITLKSGADDTRGSLVLDNQGKRMLLSLDARSAEKIIVFSANADASVAIWPDSRSTLQLGQNADVSRGLTDLTDPAINHLFLINPEAGQHLNKGEIKTLYWVSSAQYDNVFLSIGRSPYQATWLRDVNGNQAFNIPNSGSFDWDVLRINSACHDFYITIGGYANDGSGYRNSAGETFYVLHANDYGFTCPAISY